MRKGKLIGALMLLAAIVFSAVALQISSIKLVDTAYALGDEITLQEASVSESFDSLGGEAKLQSAEAAAVPVSVTASTEEPNTGDTANIPALIALVFFSISSFVAVLLLMRREDK